MSNYDIAIRAEGNATIGTGHIHRTIALAGYLKQNFDISFYLLRSDSLAEELIRKNGFSFVKLNHEEDFLKQIKKDAIVVLDGYDYSINYQKSIINNGNKLVMIDDLNQDIQIADLVINHGFSGNLSDYKISKNTLLYTGPEYAILKKEFLNAPAPSKKTDINKVLVCIGGTDPLNYSTKIVSELLNRTAKTISLITYPINPNFQDLKDLAANNNSRLRLYHSLSTEEMIKLISENSIAILQPSNIALEAATLGIYMTLIQTADNQKYIHQTLLKNQCAVDADLNTLSDMINSVSLDDIESQIEKQKLIFDKRSPDRILDAFNSLTLALRLVNASDSDTLLKWSNDPVTRQNSYNTSEIDHSSHINWFQQKLHDKNCCFLIFEQGKKAAGTVRIDIKENETVIGINIGPEFRGKKLSVPMLQKACRYFFDHFSEKIITAYIKKTNAASLKSFVNSGFEIIDLKTYFGTESYRLIKKK